MIIQKPNVKKAVLPFVLLQKLNALIGSLENVSSEPQRVNPVIFPFPWLSSENLNRLPGWVRLVTSCLDVLSFVHRKMFSLIRFSTMFPLPQKRKGSPPEIPTEMSIMNRSGCQRRLPGESGGLYLARSTHAPAGR